ncbi:MAG: undecaprenyl-phosphate glucose phosphotransferase [Thiotrichaceae bacterium]|nr:undecaprenyl-phosphate glucose phosphotransferase [Thiotrichaceae bacterium]
MSEVGLVRFHQSGFALLQRISDIGLLAGTLWLSVWLTGSLWSDHYGVAALAGVVLYYLLAEMNGMYASWRGTSFSQEMRCFAWCWFWVIQVFLLTTFVGKISATYSRQAILTWFVLAPFAVALWRWLVLLLLKNIRHFGLNYQRVVICGAGDLGKRLLQTIHNNSWMGLKIIGFYDDKLKPGTLVDSIPVLGNLDKLIEDGKNGRLDRVYITLPLSAEQRMKKLLSDFTDTAVTVYMVPDMFVFELLHSRWQDIGGMPVISIYGTPLHGFGGLLKRVEDIILSVLILILIALPMLIISLGVKLTSSGPVLFKQRRYGLGGENIWVWKFRSMTVCEDDASIKQVTCNDKRVTKFGAFLRRRALDELPQFINVLQGQMSVVGPRPHAIIHNEQYRSLIPRYMLRHVVKPGITGWAQINGFRGETDTLDKMENRIDYDLFYINNWSLFFDVKIVFLTIFNGFMGKNAY